MAATVPACANVYVVDDDVLMLSTVQRVLERAGYAVQAFPSATRFLREARVSPPCCVVLDLEMPEVNGLDLQSLLARRDFLGTIVFLSGKADVERSVEAMRAGAFHFLTKPCAARKLVDAVAQAMARSVARVATHQAALEARRALAQLSPRELDVARLVAAGLRNRQIGDRLGIAEKTVKVHRGQVMRKLRVASAVELARALARTGGE